MVSSTVTSPPIPDKVTLFVPKGFDPAAYSKSRADEYQLAFLMSFLGQRAYRAVDNFIPLPHRTCGLYINANKVTPLKDRLVERGILECDNKFSVPCGERPGKALGYRLTEQWAGRAVEPWTTESKPLRKSFADARDRRKLNFLPVHHYLNDMLYGFSFDRDRAIAICYSHVVEAAIRPEDVPAAKDWLTSQTHVIERIANQQFDASRCDYGRFHTPYTCLASKLRPCISYGGQSLTSIDIVNSQPLLISVLMAFDLALGRGAEKSSRLLTQMVETGESTATVLEALPDFYAQHYTDEASLVESPAFIKCMHADQQEFINAAMKGQFYERMSEAMGLGCHDRSEVKKIMFSVLYGRLHEDGSKKKFIKQFRHVWRWIKSIKMAQRCSSDAASERVKPVEERRTISDIRMPCLLMQRFESWLFLEQAGERLRVDHPDVPVITIHDSILTTPQHVETVKEVISQTMLRWGVPARLKVSAVDPNEQNIGHDDSESLGLCPGWKEPQLQ